MFLVLGAFCSHIQESKQSNISTQGHQLSFAMLNDLNELVQESPHNGPHVNISQ